jgi:ribosomal protein S18 acetylase RimI-like enzyme
MPLPEHVVRFWRALDGHLADVRPTPWGAVVTDARFPAIWDANYARVDVPDERVDADAVLAALRPALEAVGAEVLHVVCFEPEAARDLLADLSGRGHRLGWDLVLGHRRRARSGPARQAGRAAVEALDDGDELWEAVARSFAIFGIDDPTAVDQLLRLERDVLAPGGKRWFGIRGRGRRLVSLGAAVVLEGVGYVDNVATEPRARGLGYASALVSEAVAWMRARGADDVFLLTDPDEPPTVRLYERLGFRSLGRLASTKGPLRDQSSPSERNAVSST